MYTIALIGADGAGKSTVTNQILQQSSIPVERIYMGANKAEATHVLFTTKLIYWLAGTLRDREDQGGPPDRSKSSGAPSGLLRRIVHEIKAFLRISILISEEWYRQICAWYYVARGKMVLFDRHYFVDYYYHHIIYNGDYIPLAAKLHGAMLQTLYPRPDLVILLDAPADVLYARKSEGTFEAIKKRREEYLNMSGFFNKFVVVNAAQPQEEVIKEVIKLIKNYHDSIENNGGVG